MEIYWKVIATLWVIYGYCYFTMDGEDFDELPFWLSLVVGLNAFFAVVGLILGIILEIWL